MKKIRHIPYKPTMVMVLNLITINISKIVVTISLPIILFTSPLAFAVDKGHFEFHGYVTGIAQQPSVTKIENDTTLSGDLYILYHAKKFTLNTHIEASSTPIRKGMSSVIAQSNGDARTAISSKNEGRLQLSELYLSKPIGVHTQIHLGLLDSTLFFDTGNIANNENTQFIASDFVNNPIIDFPDYALAMVIEHQFTQTNTTRLMLSSTNGLADNPNRDYSSLFEINSDDKGLFSILESEFTHQQAFFKLGAWMHNGDHQALDNTQETRLKNYGVYLAAGKSFGYQSVEFRAGTANEKVSSAAQFASFAYQLSLNNWTLGSAYGMTKTSRFLTTPHQNIQEVEVYGRYQFTHHFSLTPSVQYFKNPFYNSNLIGTLPNDVWSMNLRANIEF